jgi:hypothetical protein
LECDGLQVTVNILTPTKSVTLASGRPVKVEQSGATRTYTLDLDVANTLILR